jgi:uncharacterized protein (DUF4415 family)
VDKHEKRVRPFQTEVPQEPLLKKPVTMRLSEDVVDYFKAMADESGVTYQSLINWYLRDCLANSRKVQINWPNALTAA